MPSAGTDRDQLVLYGSLRRGLPGIRRLGLRRALRWLGPCVVRGTLHDLGPYPGFSPLGQGLVHGDLFAVHDAGAWARLDAFEAHLPENPAASLYLRRRIVVQQPPGEAWIYIYNGELAAAPVIAAGDWLAHLRARRG